MYEKFDNVYHITCGIPLLDGLYSNCYGMGKQIDKIEEKISLDSHGFAIKKKPIKKCELPPLTHDCEIVYDGGKKRIKFDTWSINNLSLHHISEEGKEIRRGWTTPTRIDARDDGLTIIFEKRYDIGIPDMSIDCSVQPNYYESRPDELKLNCMWHGASYWKDDEKESNYWSGRDKYTRINITSSRKDTDKIIMENESLKFWDED